MFCHPAWAVGSYSSGPPVVETVGTKSTGGFHQQDVSPCMQVLKFEPTFLLTLSPFPSGVHCVRGGLGEAVPVRVRPLQPRRLLLVFDDPLPK